ncbi:MAG: cupin domain-containing protein [Gaiellaceae bacterium]
MEDRVTPPADCRLPTTVGRLTPGAVDLFFGEDGRPQQRSANGGGSTENFLVLAGECALLVEGEERPLRAWDFVHCPPGTEHVFVGTGDGPCVIFMTGRRTADRSIVYPRSELARRRSAGVETETSSPSEAYARLPHWQPGKPDRWTGLPWV